MHVGHVKVACPARLGHGSQAAIHATYFPVRREAVPFADLQEAASILTQLVVLRQDGGSLL